MSRQSTINCHKAVYTYKVRAGFRHMPVLLPPPGRAPFCGRRSGERRAWAQTCAPPAKYVSRVSGHPLLVFCLPESPRPCLRLRLPRYNYRLGDNTPHVYQRTAALQQGTKHRCASESRTANVRTKASSFLKLRPVIRLGADTPCFSTCQGRTQNNQ